MERGQFTFYASFADALSRIRKKADRCDAYDAIVRYALSGEEPDMDKLPDAAALAFVMAKPNLDASRRKAEGGRNGGVSKPEASRKDSASITEASGKDNGSKGNAEARGNRKQEKEQEKEQEKDKEQMLKETTQRNRRDESFERFWTVYPRKVGKLDARKAWERIYGGPMKASAPTVDAVVEAVERQKRSDQWTRDNGQYIPHPATWLNQGRWEDELPAARGDGYQKHDQDLSPTMSDWIRRSYEQEDANER